MEFNEFKEKMIINVDKLGINLSEIQLKQFYNYMNLLIEWNKKINLTAITEPNEIILKHFVDSLTISKYISDGTRVVDVGTGAGFPGIPLKIYRKDIEITLLDSLQKRINFLDEVIRELNLEKIETSDLTYLTNARSISLLKQSLNLIKDIKKGIDNNLPIDMLEIDLKNVWNLLGNIIGETYEEELLDQLFSEFCLGK